VQPFDSYPGGGRVLLGEPRDWANSRHGCGLDLQQVTRQTCCAYCGLSLVDTYEHWLLLSVDHVVPSRQALALGIPRHFSQDMLNLVLCCAGCNGFGNRYAVPVLLATRREDWDLSAFLGLRDAVFNARSDDRSSSRPADPADRRPLTIGPAGCRHHAVSGPRAAAHRRVLAAPATLDGHEAGRAAGAGASAAERGAAAALRAERERASHRAIR
jgi:hypothetical protein